MAIVECEISERAERAFVERVTRSAKYLAALDAAIERARNQRSVVVGIKRSDETVADFRRRLNVGWKGGMR